MWRALIGLNNDEPAQAWQSGGRKLGPYFHRPLPGAEGSGLPKAPEVR